MAKPGPKPKFTQNTLQSSAFQIAVNHGLEQLTLGRLAAAVGTSPSAIYRYFDSKEELLRAMATEAIAHATGNLSKERGSQTADISDLRTEALANILGRFAQWERYRQAHPVSYELLMPAVLSSDPATIEKASPLLAYFEEPLNHAARVGALRPQLGHHRAVLLLASLHGLQRRGDPALEHELLLTLLCGWGAPRHLLDARPG